MLWIDILSPKLTDEFWLEKCRGIKASFSFSFLEVVVGCEVVDSDPAAEQMTDDIDNRSKKTIYLHLKKYFRGTRFTFQPFLRSLQLKHKEGDTVCISGKVSFCYLHSNWWIKSEKEVLSCLDWSCFVSLL